MARSARSSRALGNTALNRRFTFGVRGRTGVIRHHLHGALVFLLTLALTNSALLVLHGVAAQPPRAVELGVLVAANLTATVTRYIAMRTWVFARTRDDRPETGANPRARAIGAER